MVYDVRESEVGCEGILRTKIRDDASWLASKPPPARCGLLRGSGSPPILRPMRTGFVVTLLSIVLVGCADAQVPEASDPAAVGEADAVEPVVIADGTAPPEWVDLSGWTSPALEPAYAAARGHWQAQDPSYEEETRVLAVTEGAFTEAGASQQAVLYLMSLWPRCCPKLGIAVIQDGALVRNVAFEASDQDLAAAPDLDGDGRDELVLIGSFGMGGQESTSMTLVSFGDAGLRTWGGTSIQDTACAAMQEGGTAARITAVPGPAFTIERFSLVSCESGQWQPAGAPEPLEFTPPGEETSVELPVR